MSSEQFEQKRQEIAETVARYEANHWRHWMLPFSVLAVPALCAAVGLGLALLAQAVLLRLGVDPDTVLWVVLFLMLVSVVSAFFVVRSVERNWYPEGAPVVLPAPSPRYRRYLKVRPVLTFGILLLLLWLLSSIAPRFQPLVMAAALLSGDVLDTLAAKWLGGMTAWQQRPVTIVLAGLYGLYALAVAAGLPQLGGDEPRGLPLRCAVLFPLLFLDMGLSVLYSHLQFRRLQRLVNEDPPSPEGTDA